MRHLPIVAALIALPVTSVSADAIVAFDIRSPEFNEIQTAHIRNGQVSVRNPGGAEHTDAIYDANADHVVIVDHGQRSYMIIDRAGIDRIVGQTAGIAAAVQAQLENLTPEQRKQMEQMMANMGLGGIPNAAQAPPRKSYRRTGDSREIGGYACDVYQVFKDDRLDTEMCVADRRTLGLPEGDHQTLRSMHAFYQDIAEKAAALMGDLGATFPDLAAGEVPGLPIAVRDADDQVTVTLSRIDISQVDPDIFGIPDGYTESSLPNIGN